LKTLGDRYLDGDFTPDEYRELKNPLVLEQAELRQTFEQRSASPLTRLEPARTFLNRAVQGFSLAQGENLASQCQFLKSVGSNHYLRDGQYTLSPVKQWKTLALYGPLRDGRFLRESVSDEVPRDFLKGAGLRILLDVLYAAGDWKPPLPGIEPAAPSSTPSTRLEGQTALRALPVTT
jgi:hypothetical protein